MVLSPFDNSLEGALCGATGALLRLGYDFVTSKTAKRSEPIRAGWWTTVSTTWVVTVAFICTGTLAATLIASSMPMEHLPVVLRPAWAGIGYFFRINRILPIFRTWSPWKTIRVAAELFRIQEYNSTSDPTRNPRQLNPEQQPLLTATVTTLGDFSGKWTSRNPDQLLSLLIDNSMLLIEEGHIHSALSVTKQVQAHVNARGHLIAERKTDDDMLIFLGIFDPDVREQILASNPPPSVIELRRHNGMLKGTWIRILPRKAHGSSTAFVLYRARSCQIEFEAAR